MAESSTVITDYGTEEETQIMQDNGRRPEDTEKLLKKQRKLHDIVHNRKGPRGRIGFPRKETKF